MGIYELNFITMDYKKFYPKLGLKLSFVFHLRVLMTKFSELRLSLVGTNRRTFGTKNRPEKDRKKLGMGENL